MGQKLLDMEQAVHQPKFEACATKTMRVSHPDCSTLRYHTVLRR